MGRDRRSVIPRTDFASERFFYNVQGIVDVGRERLLRARKNAFLLRPGRDYELRFYHYYPGEDNVEAEVQALSHRCAG